MQSFLCYIKFMTNDIKKLAVCISAYNRPDQLEKTLYGYSCQTRAADEIIIADDGSTDETRELINSFRDKLPITHVWHEDQGFRKSVILNKAIMTTNADYIIFTDQDCIPRKDFIHVHEKNIREGYFLCGNLCRISIEISDKIQKEDIFSGRAFDFKWLRSLGMRVTRKNLKLFFRKDNFICQLINTFSTAHSVIIGGNFSCFRDDLIAVNGFNKDMNYGFEDIELGIRLENLGKKNKHIRNSAINLHLDHGRPYKNAEQIKMHREICDTSKKERLIKTPNGIKKLR